MAYSIRLTRFETSIQDLEGRPADTGKVLLYGSSFFANWGYDRARDQWAAATASKLDIRNHGFGGATVDELLYYYPRLVKPYAPSALVLRTGLNDINWGLSAEEAWFLTLRLIHWAKADFPHMPILLLNVFDTRRPTDEAMAEMRRYNDLMADYAARTEHVYYLDLNPLVYAAPGDVGCREKLREIFVADGLHLTDAGYAEAAQYLAPMVLETLQ